MRGSTCVGRREEEALALLTSRHVLFSCEGRAEQVIITKLVESGLTVVPDDKVVRDMDGNPCTRLRKAKDLQREFMEIYWQDAHELEECIKKAHASLGGKASGELGLMNLLV